MATDAGSADPAGPTGGEVAAAARAWLEPRRAEMVDLLGSLVSIESPSDDPAALAGLAAELRSRFGRFGPIEELPVVDGQRGPHLQLRLDAGREATASHALALCHYDTVWSKGTLDRLPFAVDDDGVARGPGCFDMKGGIVVLYYALVALAQRGVAPRRPVRVLFTSDEETGSKTSRRWIEEAARGAAVAYVLESPLPGGTLKTARKGTGDYTLRIHGLAAHAGVEPEKGVSAVQEMAHQVLALHALNDYARGTTVNVGVVRAGTRPNVVAALAEAEIDVRVAVMEEAQRLDQAVRGLRPRLPGSRLEVHGGLNRPPMERSTAMAALFQRAAAIAAAMGVADLQEGSTGGGSDGNFTAALGVPTLDGLGPEGAGAHAAHEQVLVESLPRRAALLAGLLAEV